MMISVFFTSVAMMKRSIPATKDTESLPVSSSAAESRRNNSEFIDKMQVNIQINKDGSILVDEEIEYNTIYSYKHGIFRDIPIKSRNKTIGIKMNSIARNDEAEPYQTIRRLGMMRYKIGSQKRTISGTNIYHLNYTVYNVLEKKDGKYWLNWNAIGQYWQFPIYDGEVNIYFEGKPEILPEEIVSFEAFSGSDGEKNKDFSYSIEKNMIKIVTNKKYESNEGLTFYLEMNTDKIQPTFLGTMKLYINDIYVLSSLGAFLFFSALMLIRMIPQKRSGDDGEWTTEKIHDDVSAMFTAYLNKKKNIRKITSIGIISLISKGHLKSESDGAYTILESPVFLCTEETMLKEMLKKGSVLSNFEKEDIIDSLDSVRGKYSSLNEEKINKIAGILDEILEENETGELNFSSIPTNEIYSFKTRLLSYFSDKEKEMFRGKGLGWALLFSLIAVTIFLIFYTIHIKIGDFGATIAIGVNLAIWLTLALIVTIARNAAKLIWVWYMIIGIDLVVISGNIMTFIPCMLLGLLHCAYLRSKSRLTDKGFSIVKKMEGTKKYLAKYKDEVKNFSMSSADVNSYLGKLYPYMLAYGIKDNADDLINGINFGPMATENDVRRNFNRTYPYRNIYFGLSSSFTTAESVYERSSSSSGGSSGGGSSGGSSGGGHGGGGGGSW